MEVIAGKCDLMCPERERLWRQTNGLLHRYETTGKVKIKGCQIPKGDPEKAVKQYGRPAAGRNLLKPEELRPLPVLQKTVQYLIECIMTAEDEKWIDIYEFCSDRLRAVYQDMTVQRISGMDASQILATCVRFYLFSDYRLFDEPSVQRYDATINSNLLMECLKQILSQHVNDFSTRELDKDAHDTLAEMASIYVLFNLESHEALLFSLGLKSLRCHPLLSAAVRIGLAYYLCNYLVIFRSLPTLPILLACCLHKHLPRLRREFLMCLSHGFSSKTCSFPVHVLSSWLQIQDEKGTRDLCTYYGLTVDQDSVVFLKSSFKREKSELSRQRDPHLDQLAVGVDVTLLIGRGLESSPVLKSNSRHQKKS